MTAALIAVLIWSLPVGAAEPSVFSDCVDCPEMVSLPAGRFVMGSSDLRPEFGPPVDVTIGKPFAIASTETTFDQYEVCVAAGACRAVRSDHGWGRGRRPVINVTWDDATAYAGWLSARTGETYRLPNETEWEYAARAGTVTAYAWGAEVGRGKANCRGCDAPPWAGLQSAPVGQFAANGFGLFDVSGNVSEWVADCWADRHVADRRDQQPVQLSGDACPRRVTRGGDWYYIPVLATTAARMGISPMSPATPSAFA